MVACRANSDLNPGREEKRTDQRCGLDLGKVLSVGQGKRLFVAVVFYFSRLVECVSACKVGKQGNWAGQR